MGHPDKKVKRKKSQDKTASHFGILTFALVIIVSFIYDVILCETFINLHSIHKDLSENVYNQAEAVDAIMQSLNQMYNKEQNLNIVGFIGSSGVGKTFISNIVKKHFESPVYEIISSFSRSDSYNSVLKQIQSSYNTYNLIIVDDLTLKDTDELLNFIKDLPEDPIILLIAIFNIQETDNNLNHFIQYDQIDKIKNRFYEATIPGLFAVFHEFTASQVINWIENRLVDRGVHPDTDINYLHSVLNDQDIKHHGLKRLDSKIRLKL